MTITVTRNEPAERFEATIDGALAGFVAYRAHDGHVALLHTETLAGFEGQGVGSALARATLDQLRDAGEQAVVYCPFIRSWLTRHPGEYDDIVVLPE